MNGTREIPRRMSAEAAAWLARLFADDTCAGDESRFRTWLAEDPRHAIAFAAVLEVWDVAGAAANRRSGNASHEARQT